MPVGIKVNINGDMEQMEVEEIMEVVRRTHEGVGYGMIERYVFSGNNAIFIYSSTDSNLPFNQYEFQSSTPMGEAYIMQIRGDEESMDFEDLFIHQFKDWYEESVDLDITETETESYDSENTSDRDFIAPED